MRANNKHIFAVLLLVALCVVHNTFTLTHIAKHKQCPGDMTGIFIPHLITIHSQALADVGVRSFVRSFGYGVRQLLSKDLSARLDQDLGWGSG